MSSKYETAKILSDVAEHLDLISSQLTVYRLRTPLSLAEKITLQTYAEQLYIASTKLNGLSVDQIVADAGNSTLQLE